MTVSWRETSDRSSNVATALSPLGQVDPRVATLQPPIGLLA